MHDNTAAACLARSQALGSKGGWDPGRWKFKAKRSRYGVRTDGSAESLEVGEIGIPACWRVRSIGERCCPLREVNGSGEVDVKVEYVLVEVWVRRATGRPGSVKDRIVESTTLREEAAGRTAEICPGRVNNERETEMGGDVV
jgi:hypothetical protein